MWKFTRRSRSQVGLAVAVAAAAVLLPITGAPTPAAAAVSGITVESADSPLDSYDKTVTVACKNGKKVIDAGGYIEGGGGKVSMDDVFPSEDLSSVNVTGLESDSYAG